MKKLFIYLTAGILAVSAGFASFMLLARANKKPPKEIAIPTIKQLMPEIRDMQYDLIDIDGAHHRIMLNSAFASVDMSKVADNFFHNRKIKNIRAKDYIKVDYNKMLESIQGETKSSKDAYLNYNEENNRYEIVPEVFGNEYKKGADVVLEEVLKDSKTADLKNLDIYQKPRVLSSSIRLQREMEALNECCDFKLTYYVGNSSETLTYKDIRPWLTENRNSAGDLNCYRPYILDEEKVDEFVSMVYDKYTTTEEPTVFKTSTGETISTNNGDYDWIVDSDALRESVLEHVETGKSDELPIPFAREGINYGEENFGGTYIEVSIDNQHIWMYIDGVCVKDSPVVTGNPNKGNPTRKGIFLVDAIIYDTHLKGDDFDVHVNFWMPFDGGIGLHDAAWRYGNFGGDIYLWNGSHGCVNMPYDMAEFLYNNITYTTPIVVW